MPRMSLKRCALGQFWMCIAVHGLYSSVYCCYRVPLNRMGRWQRCKHLGLRLLAVHGAKEACRHSSAADDQWPLTLLIATHALGGAAGHGANSDGCKHPHAAQHVRQELLPEGDKVRVGLLLPLRAEQRGHLLLHVRQHLA